MVNYITTGDNPAPIEYGATVTSITNAPDGSNTMQVVIAGQEAAPRTYAAVFTSTTLGALGRIDLGDLPDVNDPLGTGKTQFTAIRTLQYDVSVKVAIKFSEAWWRTRTGAFAGGTTSTDLPVRVVVYPSWADDPTQPSVLLCSYTWAQDATRVGSLVSSSGVPEDDAAALIPLILDNLATLFGNTSGITAELLNSLMLDHHAFAWQDSALSSGAFALYGPGQYTQSYPALRYAIAGSENRLWVIGEAVSSHHAWIAGSLDSAATALYAWLISTGDPYYLQKAADLKDSWFGNSVDEVPEPGQEARGGSQLPQEFEEDVVYWMTQLSKRKPTDDRLVRQPV